MKRIQTIFLFLSLFTALFFQNAEAQNFQIDITSSQGQKLYAGIDNAIYLNNLGDKVMPYWTYGCSASAGAISKVGSNWVINISNEWIGKIINVKVMDTSSFPVLVSSKQFSIVRIPSPTATLNGFFMGGALSKSQLINADSIGCSLEDFNLPGTNFKIISFEVVYVDSKNHKKAISNEGNIFNESVVNIFKNSKPGELIIFRNINCVGIDGMERQLNCIPVFIGNDLQNEISAN